MVFNSFRSHLFDKFYKGQSWIIEKNKNYTQLNRDKLPTAKCVHVCIKRYQSRKHKTLFQAIQYRSTNNNIYCTQKIIYYSNILLQ